MLIINPNTTIDEVEEIISRLGLFLYAQHCNGDITDDEYLEINYSFLNVSQILIQASIRLSNKEKKND